MAAIFQVHSIPAVYALRDGHVSDGFVGPTEKVVREFVDSLLPTEEENRVAQLVKAGDEVSLREALELEPGNEAAVVALAELLVGEGKSEESLQLLARIPESAETRRVAALARLGSEPTDDYD